MKTSRHLTALANLCCFVLFAIPFLGMSQDKARVRVSLNSYHQMPATSEIDLRARFRGENGFEPAVGLDFEIYNVYPTDSLVKIDNGLTDMEGKVLFRLDGIENHYRDSLGVYTYRVTSLEHEKFAGVERDISFKRARLDVQLVEKGEVPNLKVGLTDLHTGDPVSGQPISVRVSRLFRPLSVGGDFNMTDESGSVVVPIDSDIPGLNGKLELFAVLSDHDEYGTVRSGLEASIGIPIEDRSTFDQRTMWAPASKTPMFLLTVPNLIIIGVWGTIIFLIVNLFKISKSKTEES
jgi:hypothetical protein